jgi:hypothetical protein
VLPQRLEGACLDASLSRIASGPRSTPQRASESPSPMAEWVDIRPRPELGRRHSGVDTGAIEIAHELAEPPPVSSVSAPSKTRAGPIAPGSTSAAWSTLLAARDGTWVLHEHADDGRVPLNA